MEEIYKEYSKIVYSYLISLTNNPEIAEELMQETFYSAVKNINKYRGEAALKTWLCRIAKNKWLDYLKKIKQTNETRIDEIEEKFLLVNSFEEEFSNKEAVIDLYKKIHKLDEKTREVIYLRIRADLSFKEIGTIIGQSEQWARVTFYRAKVKLKEEFENE
ncbi:MAG: sigma-70 family RNA polymerase sigma factor [Clostridia bacterium]|nr:sigma-70 family RNA polymerase sigma factor [Clostridia bacterium]